MLAFVLIIGGLSPQAKHSSGPLLPQWASVCELTAHPEAFDGKLVRVRAEFMSDGIERSVLIEHECPGAGILPGEDEHVKGGKSLDEALATGHPGTLDKSIVATFTGRFHYAAKPEMCMFRSKELCRRSLQISEISDLLLTMKQIEKHD